MRYPFLEIKKTIKVLRLLLFTIATSFCFYAQESNTDDLDTIIDELFFNDQQFLDELLEGSSYSFLYTSVSYNNNTFFSGRDAGIHQFNLIPQVSYYHSSGINFSVSGLYFEKFTPNWDFTSASLSYFNTIGKKKLITYNTGYTRFFYTENFNGFTNSIDLNLGVRNKKRTLGSNISASYLFGSDESIQLVSSSYVIINLLRKSKLSLRVRPVLSFIAAKQEFTFLERFDTRPFFREVNQTIFDLLNTQLTIPFSLTANSWDFELGYTINTPNAIFNESNLPLTHFFSISVGYLLDLTKK